MSSRVIAPEDKIPLGLSDVDNTADLAKPVSAPQAAALALKADKNNPAFTGTATGLTKAMVGLSAVDNTADINKPISIAAQAALNAKQDALMLTTTGTSGAATLVGATLNVPQYSGGSISPGTNGQIYLTASGTASWGTVLTYSGGAVVKFNNNPSNLDFVSSNASKLDRSVVFADIGGYGDTSFGGYGLTFPVMGMVNIPSTAIGSAHAAGVAGFAKTASPNLYAVGLYGQSDLTANGSLLWGLNTVSNDNGFSSPQVWGVEIDLNISNSSTVVVGMDLVGGSTVETPLSIAYRVGALGVFTTPLKRWTHGMVITDGCTMTGIEVGLTAVSGADLNSVPVQFVCTNGAGTRRIGTKLYQGALAFNIECQTAGDYIKLKTDPSTVMMILNNSGIGFFGSGPNSKPNLSGNCATQTNLVLYNLHTALAAFGLITNSTTPS